MPKAEIAAQRSLLHSMPDLFFSSSDEGSCPSTPRRHENTPVARNSSLGTPSQSPGSPRGIIRQRAAAHEGGAAVGTIAGELAEKTPTRRELAVRAKQVDLQKTAKAGERLALRESSAKISTLKAELAHSRDVVSTKEAKLASLRKEVLVLRDRIGMLEDVNSQYCEHRARMQHELGILGSDLARAKKSMLALLEENKVLQHELWAVERHRKEHERHAHRLAQVARDAAAAAESVRRECLALESQLDSEEAEVRVARRERTRVSCDLQAQLELAQRSASLFQTLSEALKTQLEQKKDGLKRVKAAYKALQLQCAEKRCKSGQQQTKPCAVICLPKEPPNLDFIFRRSAGRRGQSTVVSCEGS